MQKRFGIGRRPLLLVGSAALAITGLAKAQSSTEHYTYDTLGRLVIASTTGGANNGETHSLCYDSADNRTTYSATSNGTVAPCVEDGAQTPAMVASSTVEAESASSTQLEADSSSPSSSSPATTADLVSGECALVATVNLTANDSDPDGNYPLSLSSISPGPEGSANATIVSPSSVSVTFGPSGDSTAFTYTVANSQGVTGSGQLNVTTSSCGAAAP